MTNFDIFNLVNFIINKDINGNAFSPSEFDTVLNAESLRHFKKKLGLPEEYQPNAPVPREGVDITSVNQKDLRPFLVTEELTLTSGAIDMSSRNVAHVLSAAPSPQTGFPCDELTSSEYYERVNNAITSPTLYYPVFSWRSNTSLEFLPNTITTANIKYYKYPSVASTVIVANATTLLPEYDSGASVELEWDDVNKVDIAYKILRDSGINLERGDVVNYADNIVKTGN